MMTDMPQRVLADIVQTVAQENQDIEVIDRVNEVDNLPELIKDESIDVLILSMKNELLPQKCNEVLDQVSDLLVLSLVDDGRRAAVFFNDIGGGEIIKIIRGLGKRSLFKKTRNL